MEEPLEQLRHHLRVLAEFKVTPPGYAYCGLEDYLLDRGTSEWTDEPLTQEEAGYLAEVTDRRSFQLKQCFYNSQMLAVETQRLQYYEGYAVGMSPLPVHHAWLSLNGKIIDLTWRSKTGERVVGRLLPGWAYIGVGFTADEVYQHLSTYEEASSLILDWRAKFPALRGPRRGP